MRNLKQFIVILLILSLFVPGTSEKDPSTRQQIFNRILNSLMDSQGCITNYELIQTYTKQLKQKQLQVYGRQQYKLEMRQYLEDYGTHNVWVDQFDAHYKICKGKDNDGSHSPEANPQVNSLDFSVTGILGKYPYLKKNMNREKITQILQHIPLIVKFNSARILRYIVIGNSVFLEQTNWVWNHVGCLKKHINSIPPVDFLVFTIDEITQADIMGVIHNNYRTQQEFDGSFQLINKLLIELPGFMMSKNLQNSIEFNKFLIPDNFLLLGDSLEKTMKSVQEGVKQYPWKNKSDVAFWRGGDTGWATNKIFIDRNNTPLFFPRLHLVNMSINHPQILDARLTYFINTQTDKQYQKLLADQGLTKSVLVTRSQSPKNHLKYKYLPSVDGFSACWLRVPWILSSNSVLLKQTSNYVQWFYNEMIPNVHFVPLEETLSDLIDKVEFLRKNEELSLRIVKAANEFAKRKFSREAIEDQFVKFIQEYASHQRWQPSLGERAMFNILKLDLNNQRILVSRNGNILMYSLIIVVCIILLVLLFRRILKIMSKRRENLRKSGFNEQASVISQI